MSPQILASAMVADKIERKSASYHPTVWGDYFINYTLDDAPTDAWSQEAAILKEKVRGGLTKGFATKSLEEKLNLIDAVQRMGISYHYKEELEEALGQILSEGYNQYDVGDNLHTVSLLFRLLREFGYNVSSDIFNNLRDVEGGFKEIIKEDVEGMLNLYEATHFRVHGEIILDEALLFTETYLRAIVPYLNPSKAERVERALNRPIRKSLTRVDAREYITFYQEKKLHSEVLLKFAKWWKNLELARKLPFARDRITECYFWILGVYHEPQYALARKFVTKVISLTSVIDDIYDNYGITSELEMFTEAIDRWDIGAIDKLPEYMKICYMALLDVYNEMEEEMAKEGREYAVSYAKEAMKRTVKAYHEESKWLKCDRIPTFDSYMKVALVSSGYPLVTIAAFVGMGEVASKKAFEWLLSEPQILTATSFIARVMDDMVSNEFEQQRDHIPSAVQCYMNQHEVSEREACDEFNKQLVDAWKDINQAFLDSQTTSMSLLMCMLNLSRVMDYIYKDGDGYTTVDTKLKQHIADLLVNPVEI